MWTEVRLELAVRTSELGGGEFGVCTFSTKNENSTYSCANFIPHTASQTVDAAKSTNSCANFTPHTASQTV